MTKRKEIREELAELEHEQWIEWARSLMERENLSLDRVERWNKLMIPYLQLTEEQKDQDRIWADKSLLKLDSQGVVIKVDRELPENPHGFTDREKKLHFYECTDNCHEVERESMLKAGYVAVEPLKKEGE